ncbi:hypothetical protein DFQ28_010854 [Apophysomyces sp. BC1034]|nr:hypothetical protein DFQ30_008672 [Apophysomyces sp. BC1015]KAG0180047.1 hypothetical protein DFQ29_001310 [Apophysomyces sp. BC1021]KAG0191825.1 hypothetical protein DFQ28_010854 [Apophysomyces sp. BC1034]
MESVAEIPDTASPDRLHIEKEVSAEKPTTNKGTSLSDSDDDDNWDTANSSFLAGLNVSSRLKSILQLRNMDITQNDDEDDEDDSLFSTPAVFKTPGALEALLPKKSVDDTSNATSGPTNKRISKLKKRDGTKTKSAATLRFEKLLGQNTTNASDSEEDEAKQLKKRQPKKKPAKAKAKNKVKNTATALISSDDDDNDDEPLISTPKKKKSTTAKGKEQSTADDTNKANGLMFDFLGSDSDSSNEDEPKTSKKRLSKKAELEMHREKERVNRSLEVKLKPRMNKKTFADFLQRVKDSDLERASIPVKPTVRFEDTEEKEHPSTIIEASSDSDSEIEIIGGPPKKRTILLSPERPKPMFMQLSPTRPMMGMSHRDLNRQMQERIARQMLERRKKMEEAVRRRGDFTTAVQRAEKLLEKEKEAEIIDLEVQRHFLGRTNRETRDDEAYTPDDEQYMDIVLSGEEEESQDEEENVQDKEETQLSNNEDQSSDDEENLQPRFNRKKKSSRWDGLFDEEKSPVKPKKPEPAHSIANFFMNQNKTKSAVEPVNPSNEAENEEDEEQPNRTLSRLVKRTVEQDSSDDPMAEESEEETDQQGLEAEEHVPRQVKPVKNQLRSEYVEEEAEEEEDEYFGAGGAETHDNEDLDEFEEDDMLVERNEDTDRVDEAMLRAALNKDLADSDRNMVQRLLKDITSGGLRRKRAAMEAGFMLDDYDIYDDDEYDLVAIRQAAMTKRQKMLEESGDALALLAQDPKTVAFARAARPGFWTEGPPAQNAEEKQDKQKEHDDYASIESDNEEISAEPLCYTKANVDDDDLEAQWGADIEVVEYNQTAPKSKMTGPPRPATLQSSNKFEKFKSLLTEGGSLGGFNDSGSRGGFSAISQKRKEPTGCFTVANTDKNISKSTPQSKPKLLNILSSRKKFS